MSCPIKDTALAQIGFIVRDVEKTKEQVARFLDVPVPETRNSGEFAVTQTQYRGNPAPDAQCKMAFFRFGDLEVEFIEPNEAPSAWREYLETKGEGVHHISFNVKNMKENVQRCEDWGMKLIQKGEYRGGNGRYAFLDALDDLKIVVELLERDEEPAAAK